MKVNVETKVIESKTHTKNKYFLPLKDGEKMLYMLFKEYDGTFYFGEYPYLDQSTKDDRRTIDVYYGYPRNLHRKKITYTVATERKEFFEGYCEEGDWDYVKSYTLALSKE